MTKITVDKALIEQAIEALEDCRDECEESHNAVSAVAALRAALAEPAVEPLHKLIYPGGGKSLFDKLWHLTCNAVATQSGMCVRTNVLPMIELREFLHHLCVLVDSPPSASVPLLTDDEVESEMHLALSSMSYASEQAFMDGVRAGEKLVHQKAGLK